MAKLGTVCTLKETARQPCKIADLLMNFMPTANRMSMRSLKAMSRFAASSFRFLPALLVVALFLADVWVPIDLAIPMYYVAA
jgi:hypothetical protein